MMSLPNFNIAGRTADWLFILFALLGKLLGGGFGLFASAFGGAALAALLGAGFGFVIALAIIRASQTPLRSRRKQRWRRKTVVRRAKRPASTWLDSLSPIVVFVVALQL